MTEAVLEGLRFACSQNPDQMKLAEAKFAEWKTLPGFHQTLGEIFANPAIEEDVRLMSLIWIKMGVDKYWRQNLAK